MSVYLQKLKIGIRFFYFGEYGGEEYYSQPVHLTRHECQEAENDHLKKLENEVTLFMLISSRLDELQEHGSANYYGANKRYFRRFLNLRNCMRGEEPITALMPVFDH